MDDIIGPVPYKAYDFRQRRLSMPHDLDQTLEEVLKAYEREDLHGAVTACQRILAAAPDHTDALYLTGLCHGRAGSPNTGVKFIKRAVSLKPEFENYDILRGLLVQQGVGKQVTLWQARFAQYRLFQVVDAFLISYPKCGRTWLRALLGKYVLGEDGQGDPLEILRLTQANPGFCTLEISHDDHPHQKHVEKISANKRAYAGKKVIFLVRDPRDALVSYYFQYTRRGDKYRANDEGFDGSLSDFIRHEIGGLPNLVTFYNVWAANREVPADFLLVTYEDLKTDVRKALRDIVAFLDWPVRDAACIDEVVAFGSFDNMRKLEETDALENVRLKAPDDRHPESFKVRRGRVGGYTDYLTDEDIRYIDEYLQENLDDYFSVYK